MFKKMIIGCVAIVGLNGCSNMNLSGATDAVSSLYQAGTISDEDINVLALKSEKALDKQNRLASKNSKYSKRLAQITSGLQSFDGKALSYRVYLTPEVNAFALPNGSIRVYSGLMDKMNNDELLFVVGHEIGHVIEGHSKAQARTALLTVAARKAAVASGSSVASSLSSGELGAMAENLVNAQYSQSNEYDADGFGLRILQEKGKSKDAAVSALRKLAALSQKGSSVFASHPDSAKRADRIENTK